VFTVYAKLLKARADEASFPGPQGLRDLRHHRASRSEGTDKTRTAA